MSPDLNSYTQKSQICSYPCFLESALYPPLFGLSGQFQVKGMIVFCAFFEICIYIGPSTLPRDAIGGG